MPQTRAGAVEPSRMLPMSGHDRFHRGRACHAARPFEVGGGCVKGELMPKRWISAGLRASIVPASYQRRRSCIEPTQTALLHWIHGHMVWESSSLHRPPLSAPLRLSIVGKSLFSSAHPPSSVVQLRHRHHVGSVSSPPPRPPRPERTKGLSCSDFCSDLT